MSAISLVHRAVCTYSERLEPVAYTHLEATNDVMDASACSQWRKETRGARVDVVAFVLHGKQQRCPGEFSLSLSSLAAEYNLPTA